MENPEFQMPSDDELSRFLEGAKNEVEATEEMQRRHQAIYNHLTLALFRHDYHPLTPDSPRFISSTRDVAIGLIKDDMQDIINEQGITAEELYDDLFDDEDRDRVHQLAAMVLTELNNLERFLVLETVVVTDNWNQDMENVRLGSPESMAVYERVVEEKKRLYATAIVSYELGPDNPVVQTLLDFLPGEIDPESDEMITYLTNYFTEHVQNHVEQQDVTRGAYALLGIPLDDLHERPDYDKMAAIQKVDWLATMYSGSTVYKFEQAIREEARELPLTSSEVQLLIDYYRDIYKDEFTSPLGEAE